MPTRAQTKAQKLAPRATRALDLLEQGYGRNVDAVTNVSKAVAERLPAVALPFAERVPAPERLVETTFAVANRLLEIQQAYAVGLIKAMAPIRSKVTTAAGDIAPKS